MIWLTSLKEKGLRIDTVYDIGACVGEWTRQAKEVIPDTSFVMFEATPAAIPLLAKTGLGLVINACLSNPGRTSVEFFNGSNTGDSYYKENTADYENQGSITLPCVTLDETMERLDLPPPDFLKLDTQGSELDILMGARRALECASLIQVEVPFVRYNEGAPDIQKYLGFMRAWDFLPVGITETHFYEHVFIQADMLFMKRAAIETHLGPIKMLRI